MTEERNVTYLILTRFNTAIDFGEDARNLNRDWLERRLVLFEQYCIPSVASQNDKNFKWLVFCDAESPAWFREKMASYEPLVHCVYIRGSATDAVLVRHVAATGLVSTPYLITTRLDNDDALGTEYTALVQKAFRGQEREFVQFPLGLQSYRGHLYYVHWSGNPFLSLIERVGPDGSFTTVFCVRHSDVHKAGPVHDIKTAPQWLQVIHDSNVSNILRGWPRLAHGMPRTISVNWPPMVYRDSLLRKLGYSLSSIVHRGKAYIKRAGSNK